MDFSRQPDLILRKFRARWGPRRESAEEIARRVQHLVRDLTRLQPEWGRVWPVFKPRRPRLAEPDVLQLSTADLGRLIDRRGRFSRPALPAPVGPDGYHLVVAALQSLGLTVHAGGYRADSENEVLVSLAEDDALWARPDLGRELLDGLISAVQPAWIFAGAMVEEEIEPLVAKRPTYRPWLTWLASGAALPSLYETPDPPAEVAAHAEGKLRFWP